MNEAEDVCGCLACAALCGVCCVAAAEEDKRERERAAAEAAGRLKNPMIQVTPVAVLSPHSQKAAAMATAAASGTHGQRGGIIGGGAKAPLPLATHRSDADQYHYEAHCTQPRSPPRRNARKTASYRSNAYLPPASR